MKKPAPLTRRPSGPSAKVLVFVNKAREQALRDNDPTFAELRIAPVSLKEWLALKRT